MTIALGHEMKAKPGNTVTLVSYGSQKLQNKYIHTCVHTYIYIYIYMININTYISIYICYLLRILDLPWPHNKELHVSQNNE